MSFEEKSSANPQTPSLELTSNSSPDKNQAHPSPLNKRRMNFENLIVKIGPNCEISKKSSGASNKDSCKISETEETKLGSLPSSLKSPDKVPTDNSLNDTMKIEYRHSQEWYLFNKEDGSQSPFHQKRETMPQPEFDEIFENNCFRGEKGASKNVGDDSPKSFGSSKLQFGMPSRLINDYEIVEILGEGSFGKVFKCINKLDRNEYALKKPARKFIGRYKNYCLNETYALATLTALEDNSNVVRYYHSWVEDERLYLVMEYCPSSLTKEREKKKEFSEIELKKILKDICLGLSYLHRHQLVHLDVKTENILISKTQRYKLGDLGQTQKITDSGEELVEGDSRYQAPEFLNFDIPKEKRDYKKVDIFSLGMTLFELATNHDLPKKGDEWQELRNEKFTRLDQVNHLSINFKDLIKKMLSKDPSKRPSADEILTKFLQSDEEIDAKWERIVRNLLENEKKDLQVKLENTKKRRKSVN